MLYKLNDWNISNPGTSILNFLDFCISLKQLLDQAENDIKNYSDQGQYYLLKLKAMRCITLTKVWTILDILM